MPHIVFATFARHPDYQPDDRLAVAALEARGATVSPVVWNGDFAAFEAADAVVVRSTWDYWDNLDGFLAWFDRLGQLPHVYNPPSLMKWNVSKRYLSRLQEMGACLPPTRFCAATPGDFAAAMTDLGIVEAVAKPVISGGGVGVSIIRASDPASLAAAATAIDGPAIVQPLLPEIRDPGETSFLFYDGAFSHAVIKRPTGGGILCQEEHGGVTTPVAPPDWAVDEARRILRMVEARGLGAPFYARVDAIVVDTPRVDARFRLMEVELIEPTLFFTQHPRAADRFANALLSRLNR